MSFWAKLLFWKDSPEEAAHLVTGRLGETAARKFLKTKGLVYLTSNFASKRGEIDLIFRQGECLVFVEVKTRTLGSSWTAPRRAVDERKKAALIRTANDYLRLLDNVPVKYRFDVVEVLLEGGAVSDIRHLEGSFNTSQVRLSRAPRHR